jgi:ankyrin repeat protein
LDYDTTKMLLERVALTATSYTRRLTNCISTSDLMAANRLLELVLSKGNVNGQDAENALEEAAKHNNVVACELLLQHASPARNECKAIKNALAHKAERAAVVLLKDPRVTPSFANNYFIRYASEKGLADVVEALLKSDNVDPAVEQNAALRSACVTGSLKVVKLLLADPRVNPAAFTNHAIQVASLSGHTDIVKLLLADSRVNPSANANYAYIAAKQRGHKEVMALLEADLRFKKL